MNKDSINKIASEIASQIIKESADIKNAWEEVVKAYIRRSWTTATPQQKKDALDNLRLKKIFKGVNTRFKSIGSADSNEFLLETSIVQEDGKMDIKRFVVAVGEEE